MSTRYLSVDQLKLDLSIDQLEEEIVNAYIDYYSVKPDFAHEARPRGPERPHWKELRETVINHLHARLSECEHLLKTKICDDGEYCKHRGNELLGIFVGSLDGFFMHIVGFPVPAVTLFAWLVKTQWLDHLCQCPQSVESGGFVGGHGPRVS